MRNADPVIPAGPEAAAHWRSARLVSTQAARASEAALAAGRVLERLRRIAGEAASTLLVAHLTAVRGTAGCLLIHDYVCVRERALRAVHEPTTHESGCVAHRMYRSIRDRRLFYVHAAWKR